MVSRSESAAATRSSLLHAASALLDEGGVEAVTLRAVGARAGVTRGAPYGHFENKEHLLTHLAIGAWDSLSASVSELRRDSTLTAEKRVELAILELIAVGRERRHLYALMFSDPADRPEAALAATRLEQEFLAIVGEMVGGARTVHYGALLLASAHGIASLTLGGHPGYEKWKTSDQQLVRSLVEAVRSRSDTEPGTPEF